VRYCRRSDVSVGVLCDVDTGQHVAQLNYMDQSLHTSRYQKAGQKHSIKIANRSFEDVAAVYSPLTHTLFT
jgi:hypothetical protein